jgi:adenosyl cobinamide kinase/adenosyl cobinamide phosphate guanylyltransferase
MYIGGNCLKNISERYPMGTDEAKRHLKKAGLTKLDKNYQQRIRWHQCTASGNWQSLRENVAKHLTLFHKFEVYGRKEGL